MIVIIISMFLALLIIEYLSKRPRTGQYWVSNSTGKVVTLLAVTNTHITVLNTGYQTQEVTWDKKSFLKEHRHVN